MDEGVAVYAMLHKIEKVAGEMNFIGIFAEFHTGAHFHMMFGL